MPPTYPKLVRDKIPDIIRQRGQQPVTHVADDVEFLACFAITDMRILRGYTDMLMTQIRSYQRIRAIRDLIRESVMA